MIPASPKVRTSVRTLRHRVSECARRVTQLRRIEVPPVLPHTASGSVVWSRFVTAPAGTPWVRLYFRASFLGKGSYLRMVSLRDGDVMTMHQEHLAQWNTSSAYFNGNSVLIELVAGANTNGNHVDIDRVMAGDIHPQEGGAFTLATTMPALAATLRNTGFGVDGTNTNNAPGANASCSCATLTTGSRNQVQQTHTGPLNSIGTNDLGYGVDTCGGNSGSVMIAESTGLAVAIHSHGGCTTSTSSSNSGTKITHPGLQTAIAALSGGGGNNNECTGAIALVTGDNGPFDNSTATTSQPAFRAPPAARTCGSPTWRRTRCRTRSRPARRRRPSIPCSRCSAASAVR